MSDTGVNIHQSVSGDRNIFTVTGDVHVVQNLTPLAAEDRRNLMILLKRVQQFWIEGVLEKSIYHETLLTLEKQESSGVVEHPWEQVLELPTNKSELIPRDKKIGQIFDELGRSLLILGDPGSGKTTTLLELAKDLATRAESDLNQPIPVVLSLSTWKGQERSFLFWLLEELKSRYFVPPRMGRVWAEKNHLLLLLDGLDEVRVDLQWDCVESINRFVLEFGVPGMVVCSRLAEYISLPVRLRLNGAITLQPLTSEQVKSYLKQGGKALEALRSSLMQNLTLQELAQTPLMLNVMILAYHDLPVESLDTAGLDTIEEHKRRIFRAYIDRMFNRKGKTDQSYSDNQTKLWLAWLAQNMLKHSLSVFMIEQLQPGLLISSWQLLVYALASRLIVGIILGLVTGIFFFAHQWSTFFFSGIVLGLVAGFHDAYLLVRGSANDVSAIRRVFLRIMTYVVMAGFIVAMSDLIATIREFFFLIPDQGVGPLVTLLTGNAGFSMMGVAMFFYGMLTLGVGSGVVFGLRSIGRTLDNDIEAVDALSWSGTQMRKGIVWAFLLGLIFSLCNQTLLFLMNEDIGKISGAIGLMGFATLFALVLAGLNRRIIEGKSVPNQGIHLSLRNALFAGSLIGLLLGLWRGWSFSDGQFDVDRFIHWGVLLGSITFLWFGGIDFIQHYILRFLLNRSGFMPLNYAHFLDYCVRLVFMRRVGGGYIFVHRLLMEHFAELES